MGQIAYQRRAIESFRHEIIPISEKKGPRIYVMMQPYVREPKLTLTVGLYTKPKHYADQESPIGEVLGANQEGFREAQVGNAQAWYYHTGVPGATGGKFTVSLLDANYPNEDNYLGALQSVGSTAFCESQ